MVARSFYGERAVLAIALRRDSLSGYQVIRFKRATPDNLQLVDGHRPRQGTTVAGSGGECEARIAETNVGRSFNAGFRQRMPPSRSDVRHPGTKSHNVAPSLRDGYNCVW
jgi:hypothetical protein